MGRYLLARAFRKGLLGGSRFWTVLGTLGIAMRVFKKITSDKPEVAYSGELGPGQTIVISHDRTAKVLRRGR